MSWESKQDYAGLAIANSLICKSGNESRQGQYLEKTGGNGGIVATKPYGTNNASPTNDYTVAASIAFTAGQIKLGKVTTVDSKKYMLKSVSIATGGGTEPTFSASSVQVESGAATDNTFDVPAFTLDVDDIAQILFGAFTLSGSGCELTQCNAEIGCDVGLHLVNGDPVASDPSNGRIQISVTVIQTGNTVPTVSAAQGWDISSPLSCDDPDADIPTWTFQLSKPLPKTMAAASGNQ